MINLFWNKVKYNLFYAGLMKDEYNQIAAEFRKQNMRMAKVYTALLLFYLFVMALLSIGNEEWIAITITYCFGTTIAAVVFAMTLSHQGTKVRSLTERIVVVTTELLLGSIGIVTGNVRDIRNQSVLIVVVLFVIFLIFADRPIHTLAVEGMIVTAYLIVSWFTKSSEYFWMDAINIVAYGLAAAILGIAMLRIRARVQIAHVKDLTTHETLRNALKEVQAAKHAEEEKAWTEKELKRVQEMSDKLAEQHSMLREFEQIFINAPGDLYVGVLIINTVNWETTRLIKGSNDNVIHKSCGRWDKYLETIIKNVCPEDRNRVDNVMSKRKLNAIASGDSISVRYDGIGTDEDGKHRHYNSFIQARYLDGIPIIIIFSRDDTQTVEEQARQQKATEQALFDAEQANRAKTAFLNNMSHDIRTPMNAISGFTKLAQEHLDEREVVNDYLSKISLSSKHLMSLIDDVLDMSRIESGNVKLEYKSESLKSIAEGMQTIFQNSMEHAELDFKIAYENLQNEFVYCDELRIRQILINLLGNAVKFTNPGGRVSLTLRQTGPAESGYATYEFVVSDTGIGMSEEFQKKVYEPFERERTSTVSKTQGTGLGMSITKNLVELMDGRIDLVSKVGVGTTFTVVLKLKISNGISWLSNRERTKSGPAMVKKVFDSKMFADMRVLLVEDNDMNREIARTILAEAGFVIDEAVDGYEAVQRLEEDPTRYDVVLMDIQMPQMDGYEATARIRSIKHDYVKQLPIIAMTANAFEEDRQKALDAGMNAHITKPVDNEKLFGVLLEQLGKD